MVRGRSLAGKRVAQPRSCMHACQPCHGAALPLSRNRLPWEPGLWPSRLLGLFGAGQGP